jgi:hypothetical protein
VELEIGSPIKALVIGTFRVAIPVCTAGKPVSP